MYLRIESRWNGGQSTIYHSVRDQHDALTAIKAIRAFCVAASPAATPYFDYGTVVYDSAETRWIPWRCIETGHSFKDVLSWNGLEHCHVSSK